MRRFQNSYLGAVMFAFKVGPLEIRGVVNDDELIGSNLRLRGLRVVFVKEAVAFFDASANIRHILERRRRMLYGHINQPESGAPSRSRPLTVISLALAIVEKPSRFAWAFPAVAIEVVARMQSWSDFRRGRSQAYRKWLSVNKNHTMDNHTLAGR